MVLLVDIYGNMKGILLTSIRRMRIVSSRPTQVGIQVRFGVATVGVQTLIRQLSVANMFATNIIYNLKISFEVSFEVNGNSSYEWTF